MTDIDYDYDPDYLNDGPVACDDCGELFPASALWDGVCGDCAAEWRYAAALLADDETADRFTERDESPLVKPQPKGTKAGCFDV